MPQRLTRENLKEGAQLLGLATMYPASGIIEGMCKGWDFVWIDMQHGQYDFNSTLLACQAARGVGVLVACPGQPPCAISHRVVSAFVLCGVHTACLSRATRAGRALRVTLRGGLATEI